MRYEMEMNYERKMARKEGHEEGLAEGRAEGLEEGRVQGLAEGRVQGLAEGRAEGHAEGRTEGRTEGEMLKLIQIISKKVLKGTSISMIASELEETEDSVRPIYDLLISAPEASSEEILSHLQNKV
jgi:flagellar biosynthesis/type III secretory pathway protein FliH